MSSGPYQASNTNSATDFTPVCTTELSAVGHYAEEFARRDVKLLALSCDSVQSHLDWTPDILAYQPGLDTLPYPIIADDKREIAFQLKMLDAVAKDDDGMPQPARAVFFIGPDKKMKAKILYPASTGRNFDEVIRVVDSLQLTAQRRLATPANWTSGSQCIVTPGVSQEEAPKAFPMGVQTVDLPSGKPYLRTTPDPRFERVLLPSWFVPEEYDLTLAPNVDPQSTFRYEGSQSITCSLTMGGHKEITLHSKELSLLTASFHAGDFSAEAVGFKYDVPENTVSIVFEKPLPAGRGTLKMEFIGTHNNQMAGFYRSGYTDANKVPKIMVSTQFEALDARRCFPCIDEPQAKAVFKATLIVDAHLTALSNMPEEEVAYLDGGKKKKVAYLKSPKMSTYLLAFAVGEFDFTQRLTEHGVLVRVFTPPTKSAQGKFALDVACKSLDSYDDFFGLPYPLPKLDMIAIPEFAMGAMENWGLVTYREVDVLIAEGASETQKERVATVVTHELAHQWFGNLVTMQFWDGLWVSQHSHFFHPQLTPTTKAERRLCLMDANVFC